MGDIKSTLTKRCINCAGVINLNANGKYVCPYCDTEYEVGENNTNNIDKNDDDTSVDVNNFDKSKALENLSALETSIYHLLEKKEIMREEEIYKIIPRIYYSNKEVKLAIDNLKQAGLLKNNGSGMIELV